MPDTSRPGKGEEGQEGQGLAYVLIVSAVLLVFLVALVDIIWRDAGWLTGSKRRAVLLQGADAALDRALYKLQAGTNWEGLPLAGYDGEYTYSDIPGIRYRIRIQEGNWTPYDPSCTPYTTEQAYTPRNVKTDRTVTIYASWTSTGERRKLYAVVSKSKLNSAVYTEGVVGFTGNADVYWGPVISFDTGPNAIEIGKTDCAVPTHPVFYAAGGIVLGKTEAKVCTNGVWSPDPYAGKYVASYVDVGEIPDLNLPSLKSKAIALNTSSYIPVPNTDNKRYYFTGSQAWKFTDISSGAKNEWPNVMTIAPQPTVIFFDTCDGMPYTGLPSPIPKSGCQPDANGCEVKITGGNVCGAGTLVVMGDFFMGGTGDCGLIYPELPQDCEKYGADWCTDTTPVDGKYDPGLVKHAWEGFIWAEHSFDCQGTKKIYGTLGAGAGLSGMTGHVEIWFKSNNPALGSLGQTVMLKYWKEAMPLRMDVFP